MSFIAVAAITGGAALAGGFMQSSSAKKAAKQQAEAAAYAANIQKQMFDQQREDQRPWREVGGRALPQLEDRDFQRDFTMADFQKDPGYEFRMAEGQKALERSAAARGGLGSGGTLKALSRYGQDYASGEYTNAYNRFNSDRDRRFNRLSSLAGLGQTANSQIGAAGQNYANQAANYAMGAGNAAGASTIAQGNAWAGTLSGLAGAGQGYATMNQNQKWMDQMLARQNTGGV